MLLPQKLFEKLALIADEGRKSAGDGPIVVRYVQRFSGLSPALLLVAPFQTVSQ
jgi:hypothetical protein